jgi:hypothetical protein
MNSAFVLEALIFCDLFSQHFIYDKSHTVQYIIINYQRLKH